jgi:hypothetical protein
VQSEEACAGEPFPVAGIDFRSGGSDRRADSSRGRDDALATDLHGNYRSRARRTAQPNIRSPSSVPDNASYHDIPVAGIIGHRQVTEAYLAHLARSYSARLATFDQALAKLHPDVADLIPTGRHPSACSVGAAAKEANSLHHRD